MSVHRKVKDVLLTAKFSKLWIIIWSEFQFSDRQKAMHRNQSCNLHKWAQIYQSCPLPGNFVCKSSTAPSSVSMNTVIKCALPSGKDAEWQREQEQENLKRPYSRGAKLFKSFSTYENGENREFNIKENAIHVLMYWENRGNHDYNKNHVSIVPMENYMYIFLERRDFLLSKKIVVLPGYYADIFPAITSNIISRIFIIW